MAASVDSAAILHNVGLETCVHGLERAFFDAVAASGSPTSPAHARRISKDAVDADFSTYVCTGQEIASTSFIEVIRICNAKGFANALPPVQREELLDRFSVTDADLEDIWFDRLQDMISDYAAPGVFSGPVRIRGKDDLAWISDRAAFPTPLPEWPLLVNQLGLSHYAAETVGVIFVYSRTAISHSLHVPRVFEAIDWPPFVLEVDCTRAEGKTGPLGGEPARPEGVHRGFDIPLDQLTLIPWQ